MKHENDVIAIPKADANNAIVEKQIVDAKDSIEPLRSGKLEVDNKAEWVAEVEGNIERLESVLRGEPVKAEWAWVTITEKSCTGQTYVRNDGMPDLYSPLPSNH